MIVTNEILEEDIKLTKKELEAYRKLKEGYKALSELPENDGYKSHVFSFNEKRYLELELKCASFLEDLLENKRLREVGVKHEQVE